MTSDEKIQVCHREARMIMARYKYARNLVFDELVNIGFVNLTATDRDSARRQAYLYMLNFVTKGGGRRASSGGYDLKPDLRVVHIPEVQDTGLLIDLADAIEKLGDTDKMILKERFWDGRTYAEIAQKIGAKHPFTCLRAIEQILSKLRAIMK